VTKIYYLEFLRDDKHVVPIPLSGLRVGTGRIESIVKRDKRTWDAGRCAGRYPGAEHPHA
jgi:hypothetical protein